MKTLLVFTGVLLLCSCQPVIKKPLVIVYKNVNYVPGNAMYKYQDANGETIEFSDTAQAYKVGDTIH